MAATVALTLAACGAATPSTPSAPESSAPPTTIAIPASTVDLVAPPTLPAPTALRAPVTAGEPPPGEMTYEAALASTHGDEGAGTPLTDAKLVAPMRDATFVSACGAPACPRATCEIMGRRRLGTRWSTVPAPRAFAMEIKG